MKRVMATQIAATPTLKGNDVKRLLDSLKIKPTEKSNENGKKLMDYFDKLERREIK